MDSLRQSRLRDKLCPDCGNQVRRWYDGLPDGDVEPRAHCTDPDCEWGY